MTVRHRRVALLIALALIMANGLVACRPAGTTPSASPAGTAQTTPQAPADVPAGQPGAAPVQKDKPQIAASTQDDVEPNDTAEQATRIKLPTFAGILGEDDVDWYRLDLSHGAIAQLVFRLGSDASPMDIEFLSPTRESIWLAEGVGSEPASMAPYVLSGTSGGAYYLQVSGGQGGYQIELIIESQDDAGSGADAGGTLATAQEIMAGAAHQGIIGDLDEEDWYVFPVMDGQVLDIAFTAGPDAEDLNVVLLDSMRTEVWGEHDIAATMVKSVRYVTNATSGGSYYIHIYGSAGSYTLDLSSAAQNDAGSGGDAGNTRGDAVPIRVGLSLGGQLGDTDSEDWYAFDVSDGEIISLSFTTGQDAENLSVEMYSPSHDILMGEYWQGFRMSTSYRHVTSHSSGGIYYLRVFGDGGTYLMQLAATMQNDADSGIDAGDNAPDAVEIDAPGTFTGELGGDDVEDWYALALPRGGAVEFSFAGHKGASGFSVVILDPTRNEMCGEYDLADGQKMSCGDMSGTADEVWYIRVYSGNGTYSFTVK